MKRNAQFRIAAAATAAKKQEWRLNRQNVERAKQARRRGVNVEPLTRPARGARPVFAQAGMTVMVTPPAARKVSGRVNFQHLRPKVRREADCLMFCHPGVKLPYNIENDWPRQPKGRGEEAIPDGHQAAEIVRAHHRYAGWLRTVAKAKHSELPHVLRLLERSQSEAGRNSPYTTVDLAKLVGKWANPHDLERWLRHTKWRANEILRPYGVKVSWWALGELADAPGNRRIGKAAMAAAALTLARFICLDSAGARTKRSKLREVFSRARGLAAAFKLEREEYLAAKALVTEGHASNFRDAVWMLSAAFTKDTTDGVQAFVANAGESLAGGSVTAHRMVVLSESRRGRMSAQLGWMVKSRSGVDTYHTTLPRARDAAREAVQAWRRQRAVKEQGLAGLDQAMATAGLDPKRLSVLVRREDSYASGNCRPGTAAWIAQHGLRGWAIGAPKLAPFWDNCRVRGAVLAAIARVSREIGARTAA